VDNDYSGKKGWYFKELSPENKLMYDTKEQQDWYHESKYNSYYRSLVLKTDDGKDWQISPSWIGYFESLKEGKIISDDADTHFEF
jgi:hypothetical protein